MSHLITEVSKPPLTFFKIWNGGMINQLMSIEIATGICTHFKRYGMLYESCKLTTQANFTKDKLPISIKDIIDIPESLCFIEPEEQHCLDFIHVKNFARNYVGIEDKKFSEGRNSLFLDNSLDYCFENNLANYSIVFRDRTLDLDRALSKVVFKSEYREFAKKISLSLGDFNGIHLRFTDFSQQILSLSEHDIDSSFERICDIPVIIATDDIEFPLIQKHLRSGKSIEFLIINEFAKDFKSLTISNEITLGLIALLVLTYSKQFIGTPKSTYSNYIHRQINQRNNGDHNWLYAGNEIPKFSGVYSWNSFPKMPMEQKLWQMEWPESLLAL